MQKYIAKKTNLYRGDKVIAIKRLNAYGQYQTIVNIEKTKAGYVNDRNGKVFKTIAECIDYADNF